MKEEKEKPLPQNNVFQSKYYRYMLFGKIYELDGFETHYTSPQLALVSQYKKIGEVENPQMNEFIQVKEGKQ